MAEAWTTPLGNGTPPKEIRPAISWRGVSVAFGEVGPFRFPSNQVVIKGFLDYLGVPEKHDLISWRYWDIGGLSIKFW